MIRLLTKAAHSLPVSPNTFMNPKWQLPLAPLFLLTLRVAFCQGVTTESFLGPMETEQIYPCKSLKTTVLIVKLLSDCVNVVKTNMQPMLNRYDRVRLGVGQ